MRDGTHVMLSANIEQVHDIGLARVAGIEAEFKIWGGVFGYGKGMLDLLAEEHRAGYCGRGAGRTLRWPWRMLH